MLQNGNELYWSLIDRLMQREGLTQREAAYQVTLRAVLRAKQHERSTRTIIMTLHKAWGMHFTTLYRHLAKARRTICIP